MLIKSGEKSENVPVSTISVDWAGEESSKCILNETESLQYPAHDLCLFSLSVRSYEACEVKTTTLLKSIKIPDTSAPQTAKKLGNGGSHGSVQVIASA